MSDYALYLKLFFRVFISQVILEVIMKKKQQQAVSFLLAATLGSSLLAGGVQTAQALDASNDGSGKTVTDIPKPADPNGSIFKGEEWYDQRSVFEVNREDAHTSFYSFASVEDARIRNRDNSPA